MEMSGQLHALAGLVLEKKNPVFLWMDPSVGVEILERKSLLTLPASEPRFLVRPARIVVTIPTAIQRELQTRVSPGSV